MNYEAQALQDKKVSKEEFAAYWEHKKYVLSGDGVVSTGDAKDFKALLSVGDPTAHGLLTALRMLRGGS